MLMNIVIYITYLVMRESTGCETFLGFFILIDFWVSMLAAVNTYIDYDNKTRMELLSA
jgi:hypothetical protein